MKKVLKINSDGFFIEDVILQDNEVTPSDCIEIQCPEGFILPKWNGTEWVEGGIIPEETEEQKQTRYENLTVQYIREKYNSDDEYKILREKLAGTDTAGLFDTYNTYVEQCKVKAHIEIYGS